jgi:hypothetical protein
MGRRIGLWQMLNQLDLRTDAEAFEDFRQVISHCALTYEELLSDCAYSLASQDSVQDLRLPSRELWALWVLLGVIDSLQGIQEASLCFKSDSAKAQLKLVYTFQRSKKVVPNTPDDSKEDQLESYGWRTEKHTTRYFGPVRSGEPKPRKYCTADYGVPSCASECIGVGWVKKTEEVVSDTIFDRPTE